jgi:hypothetical protein
LIQYGRDFNTNSSQQNHRWVSREEFETIPHQMRKVEIPTERHEDEDDEM